jgi:integrase
MDFFLNDRNSNNVHNWPAFFDQLRIWLESVVPLKKRIIKLSPNTQNKIINIMNQFIRFNARKSGTEIQTMESIPKESLPQVTADMLIREHEIPLIYQALLESRPTSAELFIVLVRSGLRISEGLGLSLKDIRLGKLNGQISGKIHKRLENSGLGNYHGYIYLMSQVAIDEVRTPNPWTDNCGKIWQPDSVPRSPLKMRRRIDAKFARYVPIWDKQAWNIIVKAVRVQKELQMTKRFGEDESNYLLFDGLTASKFYLDLKQAQEKTKLHHRSPHKLRHTHLSWLYGEISEDPFLAEKIGGHRDKAALETYSHIREQMGQEQERQEISLDNLVEID